jgi:hypothetical protein
VAVMAYLFRVRADLLESAELNVAGAIEAMGWEREQKSGLSTTLTAEA